MFIRKWGKAECATLVLSSFMLQPMHVLAQVAEEARSDRAQMTVSPKSSGEVSKYMVRVEDVPQLTHAQKLDLIRQKIKYVFVLFQENRSFDFYFGSYPGADNLYSLPPGQTPGFNQPFVTADGKLTTIQPFRIPASIIDANGKSVPLYPADTASVNHGHVPMDTKLNFTSKYVARNDRYSLVEEGVTLDSKGHPTSTPSLEREQFGELVMSHVDCDTVPFLWNYADRFTLFDNFFDTVIGPSTPNAIAMIAGQSGETQWVKHPELGANYTTTGAVLPVTADPQPFWGSALDVFTPPSEKQPVDDKTDISTNPASNLTFATLPLSFMGKDVFNITQDDRNPAMDLADVQEDLTKIAGDNNKQINWAWYQEGYDHEPTDPKGTVTNADYIAHHNAPQYFGYIANNPTATKQHLRGLGDFYTAIDHRELPEAGGVFYLRGGYGNLDGLVPQDPDLATRADFQGNDDHPAYSDAQISEALLADEINAIAKSPYWHESAIVITYDETDGLYDHTQPKIRDFDALGYPLDQGPRIPAIVISPYSVVHTVSHERTEHSSIIKFIDELFHLTPLADLPDEAKARLKGQTELGQRNLGPADDRVAGVGDMLTAFDNARLTGKAEILPAEYAMIPQPLVTSLPHFSGTGCRVLQISPSDATIPNPIPADFNPRPDINPGIPASGNWKY